MMGMQGYLAHRKHPPSLGPPYGPRNGPTVGSQEGVFLMSEVFCTMHTSTLSLDLLAVEPLRDSKLGVARGFKPEPLSSELGTNKPVEAGF